MNGDILRVRLLDAPCSGCGRPVTVWLGWGRVVTADRGGERHECGLDSRARMRENGRSEEALSKRRQHCYPALAAPVEVLTHLPESRRISE